MTASTEQECAEFEAVARKEWKWPEEFFWRHSETGEYTREPAIPAWRAWQAARRAQVVPQGWKLVPDDANMTDEQAEAICAVAKVCGGGAYDIYRAALAAAPQPPEAA